MGVDYDGVGGIGILVDDDMVKKFIAAGVFTEEEWDECAGECMETVGVLFQEAGSACYGGDGRHYFFVKGDTLSEILENEGQFFRDLFKYGITVSRKDLKVVSDIHIW